MRSTVLFVPVVALGMSSCAPSDVLVPNETEPVFSEPRIETAFGTEATRRALAAVSGALSNPKTLSVRLSVQGQSTIARRDQLLALKDELESRLAAQNAQGSAAPCVVHDDAEFESVFTIVGIDEDSSHLFGYTATTKTTRIQQSAYLQVDRDHWWPDYEYGPGRERGTRTAICDDTLSIGLGIEYVHYGGLHGSRTYHAYGETTHIVPEDTDWTQDYQSHWHGRDDDDGEN